MRFEFPTIKSPAGAALRRLRSSRAGIAMMEAVMATAMVMTIAVGVTQMFLVSTRMAASNRVLTAARIVIQRNLDNALTLRWDSTVTPSVLAITAATGVVYDDDGNNLNGEGTNKVALLISKDASDTAYTVIPASMTRTVTAVTNTQGADIRLIKFSLTYTFQNRTQVVQMSTMRAIDD